MTCHLPITMLGLLVAATWAGADPSSPGPTDSPYLQSDADGVPLLIAQPQSGQDTDAMRNAAGDKDWLLRGYEQQRHARAAAGSPGSQETDLYYEISSNKELARLAGLPGLDSTGQGGETSYQTGAATVRGDASSAATGGFTSQSDLFKPLISPLSGLGNGHSDYLSPPISMASPFAGFLPPPSPRRDLSLDSTDIETPGLVAAEKGPLLDTGVSDLDMLPGETVEHARAHQDNLSLELPAPMNATQLHKAEATILIPPTAPKAAPTAMDAPAKTAPVEDPNAPLPVDKITPINPVRSPVANPYDILDR